MVDTALLSLPSPFEIAPGQVLLREPADADPAVLRARLVDGSYGQPFVIDDGQHLTLYLGSIDLMQTVMAKAAPEVLQPGYGPRMMLWLLFAPRARRLAMIGLGGGALAKFCLRQLPEARLEVVECDPAVTAWRDLFGLPPDDARFRIHVADGAGFLADPPGALEVLMIDAFDAHGFAPQLASHAVVADAFDALAPSGLMVVNLAGPPAAYLPFIAAVRDAFDDQLLVAPVPEDGNHVLLAFKDPAMRPVWHRLHKQAASVGARHGLDFARFVAQAERIGWRRLPPALLG
jgi:spermidine synthase